MPRQLLGGSAVSTSALRERFRHAGWRLRRSTRRRRALQTVIGAITIVLAVTLLPGTAWAIPPGGPRNGPDLTALQTDPEASLDEDKAAQFDEWEGQLTLPPEYVPEQTDVPEGGSATVPLDSADGDLVQAGSLPVSIGQASPTPTDPTPPAPRGTWQVELQPRTATETAGVDGAVITVTPPADETTPVDVELDYSTFEDLYGTEWASRLQLVQLPQCFLDTPEAEGCATPVDVPSTNDPGEGTVRATADPAQSPNTGLSTLAVGGPMVLAAVDGAAGAGGTYKATSLSPSGSWTAGGSGGGFSWSYPLSVPPAPAGPTPGIAFTYSSQSVDGKTSVANSQASWIGDGWDYNPGFIERRYRSCSDDLSGTPNNDNSANKKKSDLCWAGDNVVMSLNGSTTPLVHDDATGDWVPANDSGIRVEHKTDTALANGDNNGEYWIVTARNGTRYWFGRNKVGGGRADTDSVFTVPVFGNHSGEPCHASAFADSSCTQAWRWNLDLIEDVSGNAMVIDWARETNQYAKNGDYDKHVSYVRGGYPTKIEYGLRADNLDGAPAGRVVFTVAERCIKQGSVDCSDADFESSNYGDKQAWWDTPSTLFCKADAENCYVASPTFWSRKRLSAVTTYAQRTPGSTALSKVDSWKLEQSFPKQRTDTHPPLWLDSITRTGYGTDGEGTTLPPVTFLPNVEDMPNRVARSSSDPTPDFDRLRVATIRTETGGEIQVSYSDPCALGASPDPETNGTRCFPVRWSPDGGVEQPNLEYFNKYVVTKVVEKDRVARQPDVVTTYTYEGDAAWAKSTDEFTKPERRTFSDWRGYASVIVKKGTTANTGHADATVQSQTRTRYFRGMSEDAGRATVAVKDSTGQTIAEDLLPYQGRTAEVLTYDKAGGDVVSRTVTTPQAKKTASRSRSGVPDLDAWRTGTTRTDAFHTISGDRQRSTHTVNTIDDTYGLIKSSYRYSLTPDDDGGQTTGDQQCTTNTYVHNTSKHLIGLLSRQRVTVGTCDEAATATTDDVVSDTRTSYDTNDAYGDAPSKGLAYQVQTVDADGEGWITDTTYTYDAMGRVTSTTDAEGNTSTSAFSPPTGTAFSMTATNAAGFTSTTDIEPGRGTVLTTTDTNGRTVTTAFDNLGRTTAVWTASQDPDTDKAAYTFSYQIREDEPPAVTTRTLRDNGTYRDSVTLYDGLLRVRQQQSEAVGGGRIVTDTRYNSLGQVAATNNGYLAKGEPDTELFVPESVYQIPNSTETAYDGMSRPVKTTTLYEGDPQYATLTEYTGDSVLTWAGKTPDGLATLRGSTAAKTWTDVLGRTTRIQHYTTPNLSDWTNTRYQYGPRGNLKKVTDQDGNAWTYTYDSRNQRVTSTDPDVGHSSFTYDDLGRQVTATDSKGHTRYTAYDVLGRKKAVHEDSSTGELVASWTYDTLPGAKGQPVSATRYTDGAAYTSEITGYDAEYRPTGTKITIPDVAAAKGLAGTYTYTQTYTTTGKPLTHTLPKTPGGLPSEKVITRYNGEGLPVTTSGQSWYTADTIYSPYGEVLRTVSGEAPQRVWSTAEYNPNTGRLSRTVTDREKAGPHRLSDTRYAYDIAGNVSSVADTRGDGTTDRQCFSYDASAQLRQAWTAASPSCPRASTARDAGPEQTDVTAGPDGDGYWNTYQYDALGNRTKLTVHDLTDSQLDDTYTYTYGSTETGNGLIEPIDVQPHTLTRVDSVVKTASQTVQSMQTYAYDNTGNTKERTIGGDTQKLTWTPGNHLASVDTTNDGSTDVSYIYDAEGNRLIEKTATGATLFLGGAEITVDSTGTATDARRYYAQAGAPTIVRETHGSSDLSEHSLTALLSDQHNTATTAVALDDTMAVQRRKFGPFGEPRGDEPNDWPSRHSFLGAGIDDPLTGLTHMGAREYDPTTGRFLSADPLIDITDPQQMNGYAYANNNPTTYSDPSGKRFCAADCSTYGEDFVDPTGTFHDGNGDNADYCATHRCAGTPVKIRHPGPSANDLKTIDANTGLPLDIPDNKVFRRAFIERYDLEMMGRSGFDTEARIVAQQHALLAGCTAMNQGHSEKCLSRLIDYHEFNFKRGIYFGRDASGATNGFIITSGHPHNRATVCHSFTSDTEVLLADGTHKAIEDVEVGDQIVATDPQTGKTKNRVVAGTILTKDDEHFVDLTIGTDSDSTSLTTTANHPFWSPSEGKWVLASDLTPGMTLRTAQGAIVEITATRAFTKRLITHDLTVTGTHTYYVLAGATPVLVHNCGTTPPGVQCNCAPGTGAGPADAPIRNSGAWTRSDIIRGSLGLRPNHLGNRIEIHHADQMPGSAIHELDQNVHRGAGTDLHRNPHNQGVTKDMRKEDTQLHWWYRSQEQGWGTYSPDHWFDNWPE